MTTHKIIKLLILIIFILVLTYVYFDFIKSKENANVPNPVNNSDIINNGNNTDGNGNVDGNVDVTDNNEMMNLVVYIQDKSAVSGPELSCTVTEPKTYNVPKTTGVADASLKILFADELKQFGQYDSVTIASGVAKVMLKSNRTSNGGLIGSLSSCESGHLMSVLKDTLTQYPTIQSVELYSPQGKIEF